MNVIAWARGVLADVPEATLESDIARLVANSEPGMFQRQDVQFQFWKWLVRDARRALKVPSVPVEQEELPDQEVELPRITQKIFRADSMLSISDVRWILKGCRETIGQNMAKGRRYMKLAVNRGWRELRDEFPEFDNNPE